MKKTEFKYIYGPVYSWRMGYSLGIDPVSDSAKICNMDCVYCQLGRSSRLEYERKVYVPTEVILEEIKDLDCGPLDYITFSGRGEPTLALNLSEMIQGVRALRNDKIAVITNASFFPDNYVRDELKDVDYVLAKLDGYDQKSFDRVDVTGGQLTFNRILDGLIAYRAIAQGKLAVAVMFIQENIAEAKAIADLIRRINPHEVHVNTPTRPSGVRPLGPEDLKCVLPYFEGLNVINVYDEPQKEYEPMDEAQTKKRHGNYTKSLRSSTFKGEKHATDTNHDDHQT